MNKPMYVLKRRSVWAVSRHKQYLALHAGHNGEIWIYPSRINHTEVRIITFTKAQASKRMMQFLESEAAPFYKTNKHWYKIAPYEI